MTFRFRQSVDAALAESFGHLAHGPFISVENVTRRYEPIEAKWIHRAMAIFGGLGVGYTGSGIDEDDDDDMEEDDVELETRRSDTPTVALDRVDLLAVGGTCVALVGPAASGKTTLLRVMGGIAPPTSGRVVAHGLVAPALEGLVGSFPKFGRIDGALVGLGALLGISARRIVQHREEIYELYGHPAIGREPVSTMPRRVKKDLILAMMLCLDADIVLVDFSPPKKESDRGRDVRIAERLGEIRHSGAVLIVTARDVESVAAFADRVIFLDKGRVVGDHPIEEAVSRAAELVPAGRGAATEDDE